MFNARDFDTAQETFAVATCLDCGLACTADVNDDALSAAYSRSYYGSERAKFVPAVEAMVRIGQKRQVDKILRAYRGRSDTPQNTPLSVLDIGCGRGLLLREFAARGAHCLGIERDEFPGANSTGVDVHIGALDDAALAERRFDIIVIWHVLEHVTELGALLRTLPAHLNPGGLLVISVPNFSSWQSRLFGRHWFHLDIPRHVSHFQQQWLENQLDVVGLTVESHNTFTATQNVYGFLQSALNALFPARPNRLYHLLTRGRGVRERLPLIGWGLLGALLMPIAIIETLFAEIAGKGATLNLYARLRER